MSRNHVFISHATPDDAFVRELRTQLEGHGVSTWVDSRNLRGGDKLHPEIEKEIREARHVVLVLSPHTANSAWVQDEVKLAEQVASERGNGFRVVPLLLPGVLPGALGLWFDDPPVAHMVRLGPGGLSEAMPHILASLDGEEPDDVQPPSMPAAERIADLVLELKDPQFRRSGGKRKLSATAALVHHPATPGAATVESRRFKLTAPLGPIEADDLRWYLEQYHIWPVGVFQQRAKRVEKSLSEWGRLLHDAALGDDEAEEALHDWLGNEQRRFSIEVDPEPPKGAKKQRRKSYREASTALMALPWELLHDKHGFLFHGKNPVRVRRRLPNRSPKGAPQFDLPVRVLVLSPRPADAGYFDHRSSALPLVQAVEQLGDLAEVTVLTPPTIGALEQALGKGHYHIVHFDGHGAYHPEHGLGGLCFEKPDDPRETDFITGERLAEIVREHRIPVVFLDACQGARADVDINASVAASILAEGVTSVVAMTHSVLVPTARKFVEAFYLKLAEGTTVGDAMLAGQQALHNDTYRLDVVGAGKLHLQDWFVPVLYQEEQDPQLFRQLPSPDSARLQARQRDLRLGDLPATPNHTFIGRSVELLALERRLLTPASGLNTEHPMSLN